MGVKGLQCGPPSHRPSLGTPQQTHPLDDRPGGLGCTQAARGSPQAHCLLSPLCPMSPFCLMSQCLGHSLAQLPHANKHRARMGTDEIPKDDTRMGMTPRLRVQQHLHPSSCSLGPAPCPEQEQDPPTYPLGVTLQGLAPASSLQGQACTLPKSFPSTFCGPKMLLWKVPTRCPCSPA